MTEYQALILGLQMGIKDLDVYDDSQLVIDLLLAEYRIKKEDLVPYHRHALQILDRLDIVKLQHIPMSANKMADMLANLATTLALGTEEDMTIPVYAKWVVAPMEDAYVQEVSVVSVYEVEKED